jgi:hypothetical protein
VSMVPCAQTVAGELDHPVLVPVGTSLFPSADADMRDLQTEATLLAVIVHWNQVFQ